MDKLLKYSGLVALVILAIMVAPRFFKGQSFGTAISCATDVTCFTKLGALTSFQVDGTSIFNGAVSFTAAITQTATAAFTSTVKIGTNGSNISGINFGTCYVQAAATTIAASSTVTVDCQGSTAGANTALTGVTTGDVVHVQFASTTPTTYHGLNIHGASASSTPGYITMSIFNGTGASYTWTSAASTTNYTAFR